MLDRPIHASFRPSRSPSVRLAAARASVTAIERMVAEKIGCIPIVERRPARRRVH